MIISAAGNFKKYIAWFVILMENVIFCVLSDAFKCCIYLVMLTMYESLGKL